MNVAAKKLEIIKWVSSIEDRAIIEQLDNLRKQPLSKRPNGWEDGLTPDEFLTETKKMLREKFDERNQVS